MKLAIATSYFPVSENINNNLKHILKQMTDAQAKGADVIHFPETALSGYAEVDFPSFTNFDWKLLKQATLQIVEAARVLKIWVILGSSHQLSGRNKPYNSLYIISDQGKIVDRYDKLFCAGPKTSKGGDLAHYSSGNHFCTFKIKGVRCGVLICHDARYPELYRQYKIKNVQVMFHSYHAGNTKPAQWKNMTKKFGKEFFKFNRAETLPGTVFPATMQSMAANNFMWISCSNSSAKQSCFPAFFVRADGVMTGILKRNIAGILTTIVDTKESLYDSTVAWRERAIKGNYYSGKRIKDVRADNRTQL